MLRLLSAALAAADRGWPVFPVVPGGKRPAITGWPRAASVDAAVLAAWWERAPYNVGIACGPAGLLVVDFDSGGGPAVLAGRFGALPVTYRVVTPRGEHHYFAVPPVGAGVATREQLRSSGRSTAGMLSPGVDTRGPGGYVLAAGSVRRVDGRRVYYRGLGGSAVARAPGWLLDALLPPAPAYRAAEVRRAGPYAAAALRRETAGVAAAGPGGRNARLFGAAVRLGQLVAGGLLAEDEVVLALEAAAARHVGIDGFTAGEVTRAVDNGLSYGRRRPRGAPSVR